MATLRTDPNGTRRILFVCPSTGARKTVRLGRMPIKAALAIQTHVEALAAAKASRQPVGLHTARWIGELGGTIRDRIEKAGLIEPADQRDEKTLAELLADFEAAAEIKPATAVTYRQTYRALREHFGEATAAGKIAAIDAERWRQSMVQAGLSKATISKRVKTARQIFRQAIRWKYLAENPFADVRGGAQTNRDRMYFVSPDDVGKLLEACPDAEWRLMVALSRYAGLRTPSESLALTWADVNWERMRLTVRSPKTERYAGKAVRIVPIFPQLYPHLRDAFEAAPAGAVHVITRYRDPNANLRTRLSRTILRAGLTPWPRLWHNLRASRQTELCETFPAHVVSSWLGNSVAVAQAHYLQITDAHFERATMPETSDGKAAQKAAQSQTARHRGEVNKAPLPIQETPGKSITDDSLPNPERAYIDPYGIRTTPVFCGKTGPDVKTGTQSGTLAEADDPELNELVAIWPSLPADVKARVLGMARRH